MERRGFLGAVAALVGVGSRRAAWEAVVGGVRFPLRRGLEVRASLPDRVMPMSAEDFSWALDRAFPPAQKLFERDEPLFRKVGLR
jgi:hypothetical protein